MLTLNDHAHFGSSSSLLCVHVAVWGSDLHLQHLTINFVMGRAWTGDNGLDSGLWWKPIIALGVRKSMCMGCQRGVCVVTSELLKPITLTCHWENSWLINSFIIFCCFLSQILVLCFKYIILMNTLIFIYAVCMSIKQIPRSKVMVLRKWWEWNSKCDWKKYKNDIFTNSERFWTLVQK